MADIPASLDWGIVEGRIGAIISDAVDTDRKPNIEDMPVTVTLSPYKVRWLRVSGSDGGRFYVKDIVCTVVDGYLTDPETGELGVPVIASPQDGATPHYLQWVATIRVDGLTDDEQPDPILFDVPGGGQIVRLGDQEGALERIPFVTVVSAEDRNLAIAAANDAGAFSALASDASVRAQQAAVRAENAEGDHVLDADGKLLPDVLPDELTPTGLSAQIGEQITDALEGFEGGGTVRSRVVLIGDSLTQNWGGHTAPLAASLGRSLSNLGVGGQRSNQIAARQGGAPALLTVAGDQIPESGPVSVTTPSPNLLRRPSDGTQTLTGVLAGVEGVLRNEQVGASNTYTFTRSEPGIPMPCPPGTPFATGFTTQDSWPIIWTGRNDIGAGVWRIPKDDIIGYVRKMLAWNRNAQRALVLSVLPRADEDSNGTSARAVLDELNDALRTAFPEVFFDLAGWLRTDIAFAAAGITRTAQDDADIAAGLTPTSFRSDYVHLNATGYAAVNAVLPRVLDARGWDVTSLPPITIPDPDPEPEPELHSYGRTDATHRYVADMLTAPSGTVVSTWPDLIGQADWITAAGSTQMVMVVDDGGHRAIAEPGVAITAPQTQTYMRDADLSTKTAVIVVRFPSPPDATATRTLLESANRWKATVNATTGAPALSVSTNSGGTGLLAGDQGEFTTEVGIMAVSVDPASGAATLRSGASIRTGTFTLGAATAQDQLLTGQVSVRTARMFELIEFDKVLTAAEQDEVMAALATHYGI